MGKSSTIADISGAIHLIALTPEFIYFFQFTFPCTVLLVDCQAIIKHVYINIWRVFSSFGAPP